MLLPLLPPLVVALGALVCIASTLRFRRSTGGRGWSIPVWLTLTLGGAVAAFVVRATETIVREVAVGGRLAGAENVRQAIFAFGIVGPVTVLAKIACRT